MDGAAKVRWATADAIVTVFPDPRLPLSQSTDPALEDSQLLYASVSYIQLDVPFFLSLRQMRLNSP